MDRSRAGNPGRRGVSTLRINPNSEISEREGVDYRRAPRAGVQSLEGPRAAGGRNASDDATPNRPDLSNASSFPLRPGRGTVRNLKAGGKVAAKAKVRRKAK